MYTTESRPRRIPALVGGLALLSAMAGCGSHAPSLPTCEALPAATLPDTAGSVTQADTGTYCLGVGKVLDVFLTAPAGSAPGRRWSPVAVSDTSVLGYGNNGVLTPPVTVTPAILVGVAPGVTTITSALPGGGTWKAMIVVH